MNRERQDVRAFFVLPYIDAARTELPKGRLEELLESLGLTEAELRDSSRWISLDLCERFCETFDQAFGDPTLFDRLGRQAFSARYLGVLRPIIRTMATPGRAFRMMAAQFPRFNKVGAIAIEDFQLVHGRGSLVYVYRTAEGAPRERTRYLCAARAAQMGAFPTLFDLPPATVKHRSCLLDGDEACVYEVEWTESRRSRRPIVGLAVGAVVGVAGAVAFSASAPLTALIVAAGGLVGLTHGRAWDLGRTLGARVEDLAQTHNALLRTTEDNEGRYQELLDAKSSVEREVVERTAALTAKSDELEASLAEVQDLARARDRFFANVSHDLKTPLQLLLTPIDDLLAGHDLPPGTAEVLRVMRRNAERELQLVDQLLQAAQLDAGAPAFRVENVDLEALIRATVDAYSTQAEGLGVSIELDVEPTGAVAVDPRWMQSLLDNLIANALRFSPHDARVQVGLRRTPTALEISVEDEGQGVEPGAMAQVFERYVQAGDARHRREGVGLGLAIVREAAQLHRGDARVDNKPEGGARFVVELPLRLLRRTSEELDSGSVDIDPLPPRPALDRVIEPPEPQIREGAPKILLVEDHPEVQRQVAGILARRYSVVVAPDGAAGLRMARAERPTLIVSDVSMPEMDGYALCRQIRADPELRTTPIILLTAHGASSALVEGFEAGADDYVAKPVAARELLARIDAQLRLRRLMTELVHTSRLASLGTLAGSLAHQIRNPMGALGNCIEMLTDGEPMTDDVKAQLRDAAIDSGRRVEQVLANLMRVARGRPDQLEPVEPVDVLDRTIDLMRLGGGSGVALAVQDPARSISIAGNPGELSHVFMVLIDNAWRAEPGEVRVTASVEEATLVIQVIDRGPGISSQDLERVFEPFYTTRPAGEGTGLGLTLARSIVERHGGTLRALPGVAQGTVMEVRLPIEAADPDPSSAVC